MTHRTALPESTALQLDRIREQLTHKQAQWGDRETHIPVELYFSPEVRQAEIDTLFRPLPLIAAHSSEVAPGHVLAHDGYGVPILLSRDAQGQMRAFLNVCRHRGMRLAASTGEAQ